MILYKFSIVELHNTMQSFRKVWTCFIHLGLFYIELVLAITFNHTLCPIPPLTYPNSYQAVQVFTVFRSRDLFEYAKLVSFKVFPVAFGKEHLYKADARSSWSAPLWAPQL